MSCVLGVKNERNLYKMNFLCTYLSVKYFHVDSLDVSSKFISYYILLHNREDKYVCKYENCEMAFTFSSSRADSASVPGVTFKWV